MFNSLPKYPKALKGISLEKLKKGLDIVLSQIPDMIDMNIFARFVSSLANITADATQNDLYGRAAETHKNLNRTFIFDLLINKTGM